jgi:hypothetical protein
VSVIEDAVKITTAGLNRRSSVERLRGACALERARFLFAQPGASWTANTLAARLKAELAEIQRYIKSKNALIAGTETMTPPHLNLKDEAGLASSRTSAVTALEKEYRANRRLWVCQIVWRAVAIHAELWKAGDPPKLEETALDEVLDRRIRVIEQMDCNVNGGVPSPDVPRSWKVAAANSGWKDGFMNRNFEYPGVRPLAPFKPFLTQMQPLGWSVTGDGNGLVWSDPTTNDPRRFPTALSASWKVDPADKSWIVFQPRSGVNSAGIFKSMLDFSRIDFWNRSWLYCDHVSSALCIEAMLFGGQRRAKDATERATNAQDMETLLNTAGHVKLGPVVGNPKKGCLMCEGKTGPHFENGDVGFDYLQVGDLVRFWNSLMYGVLPPGGGAWGSEFSFVMGIDIDDRTGKIMTSAAGPKMRLAGHGVDTTSYNGMALDTARQVDDRLATARILIDDFLDTHPNADFCPTVPACDPCTFELWSPYEEFEKPGAWWVKVPQSVWNNNWDFANINDVLNNVPRVVSHSLASGGQDYNPPKDKTAVYFPLYEPVITPAPSDGDYWREYLRKRKADPDFLALSELRSLTVDGRLALGLFYYGKNKKVSVVRPKVRK